MHPLHVLGLTLALLGAPQKPRVKTAAAAPAKTTPAVADDPVQKLIDGGTLKGTYNPVLLRYLSEEAKGKLPEAQRTAAIEQLVAGFRQQVKVDKSAVATAHLATAAGALLGGDAGAAISDTMARVWGDWVDAALILQKAGYRDEAAAFFERCIQEFALPELKARCTVALAAQSPDRAFTLVLGLVDNGKGAARDTEIQNMGLRLLGEMAGGEAVTKEQKDRAMEELMKRTKGFSNVEHKVAAAQGLVASRDPRATEPLRAMTKGTFKDRDASRVATRGLFLVFKDAEATAALQKQLKGGFLSQAADQVDAAVTLIEGGDAAAFDFAGKFLSKKRKDEELQLAAGAPQAIWSFLLDHGVDPVKMASLLRGNLSRSERRRAFLELVRDLGAPLAEEVWQHAFDPVLQRTPFPVAARELAETAVGTPLVGIHAVTGELVQLVAAKMGTPAFTIGSEVFISGEVLAGQGHAVLVHEAIHAAQQKGQEAQKPGAPERGAEALVRRPDLRAYSFASIPCGKSTRITSMPRAPSSAPTCSAPRSPALSRSKAR